MKEIILKIIVELEKYNQSNKVIDEKLIDYIINEFVNYYSINEYVKKVIFTSRLSNEMIDCYNVQEKKIYFSLQEEINIAKNSFKKNGIYFNLDEQVKAINLEVIGAIIHELTHALQYSKCLNKDKDIETELLNLSLERNLILLNNGFNKSNYSAQMLNYLELLNSIATSDSFYYSQPSERMANITANNYESMICDELSNSISSKVKNYVALKTSMHKGLGYNNVCPSAFYKSAVETAKEHVDLDHEETDIFILDSKYKEFSKENNLSLEDRLYYGFPISDYETKKMIDKENQLIKKLRR